MKIVGHRGAMGVAPENTLASLQAGLAAGVDELEFDIRVTKDQIPILHHDAVIVDGDGTKSRIADCDYQALKQRKPDLATLAEALDLIGAKSVAHIEVKGGEAVEPISKLIKRYLVQNYTSDNLLLASRNLSTLRELHVALPDITKVIIEPWSGVRATRRAREFGTKRLSMSQKWLWGGFIRQIHRGGYELYAYTLDNPKKAKRWARYGIAGVITDYPDRFQQ